MSPDIAYLPDDSIDDAGDQELRDLLTTCFTKPQDFVFKTRRYFQEPYKHRWTIRDEHGVLIAHVGVHEKTIEADGQSYRIGGICEVCVHPNYRGRGYVKAMLECVHDWLTEHCTRKEVCGMLFVNLFLFEHSCRRTASTCGIRLATSGHDEQKDQKN